MTHADRERETHERTSTKYAEANRRTYTHMTASRMVISSDTLSRKNMGQVLEFNSDKSHMRQILWFASHKSHVINRKTTSSKGEPV